MRRFECRYSRLSRTGRDVSSKTADQPGFCRLPHPGRSPRHTPERQPNWQPHAPAPGGAADSDCRRGRPLLVCRSVSPSPADARHPHRGVSLRFQPFAHPRQPRRSPAAHLFDARYRPELLLPGLRSSRLHHSRQQTGIGAAPVTSRRSPGVHGNGGDRRGTSGLARMAGVEIAISQSYRQWPAARNRARRLDRRAQLPAVWKSGAAGRDSVSRPDPGAPPDGRRPGPARESVPDLPSPQANPESALLPIQPGPSHARRLLVHHSGRPASAPRFPAATPLP